MAAAIANGTSRAARADDAPCEVRRMTTLRSSSSARGPAGRADAVRCDDDRVRLAAGSACAETPTRRDETRRARCCETCRDGPSNE